MAQVSSMASTVSQENKLLSAENRRLLELREQQAHALNQKQVRSQPCPRTQGNGCAIQAQLIHALSMLLSCWVCSVGVYMCSQHASTLTNMYL
jgi:hypothetical protein